MPQPPTVPDEIKAWASAMTELAAPVAGTIDRVAFAGAPPRVVTFTGIDQALHQRMVGTPQTEEFLEPVRYCDRRVIGEGFEDDEDFELSSEELIRAAADCIRGAAENLTSLPPDEASEAEEAVRVIARFIVRTVVLFAQLVGEQLLVLELAQAVGADPVPLTHQLVGGGEA